MLFWEPQEGERETMGDAEEEACRFTNRHHDSEVEKSEMWNKEEAGRLKPHSKQERVRTLGSLQECLEIKGQMPLNATAPTPSRGHRQILCWGFLYRGGGIEDHRRVEHEEEGEQLR
ncbi:hypothetical protein NDU88_007887 [Pleurodeles waltl]|uniref:Uncharacterized protein n=1 Tax=Pleurodeles waltl TaxID=8319 RepID=A0AAV7QR92_PLEWA|nr:hypothetical protein NDU88_007887 [Pleurodeles waltl]